MNKIILILLTSILAISCQSIEKQINIKENINLNGNWEYLGFGKAIIINDSIVQSYHTSSVGNVQTSDNSSTDFFKYYTIDTLSNDTILLKDGVKTFKLFRSNKDFAKNVNDSLANDPKYNFEVLWNTFNEQYAYFRERDINWDEMYKKYEPQIKSDTKRLELYLIFEKMLEEINDGHVSIDLPGELEKEYNSIKENATSENQNKDDGKLQKEIRTKIVEQYIEDIKKFNRGSIKYGKINESIGYVQIQNMVTMAHYNIPDSLSNEKYWEKWWVNLNLANNYHDDIRKGTGFMMDSIIRDLGDVKALIIDLRFNGGGFDDASIEILNHLASEKTDFSTKKVRLGKGFTEKQSMSINPSKNNFNRNIYVLTSHLTASASELLVLGAKELPNSKIIGSKTEGIFSDILSKKLPNGWTYGLSNMVYENKNGVSYENIGIEPHYTLDYPLNPNDFYEYLLNDLKNGDDAIEKVIELTEVK